MKVKMHKLYKYTCSKKYRLTKEIKGYRLTNVTKHIQQLCL